MKKILVQFVRPWSIYAVGDTVQLEEAQAHALMDGRVAQISSLNQTDTSDRHCETARSMPPELSATEPTISAAARVNHKKGSSIHCTTDRAQTAAPCLLRDEEWVRLEALLPRKAGAARNSRPFLEAVLWIGRTGAPWRDLPPALGHWHTTFTRFARWAKAGVWERLLTSLSGAPDSEAILTD